MDEATTGANGTEDDFGKFEDMKKDLKAPDVMYEGWSDSVYGRERQRVGVSTYTKSDDVETSDRVTVYTTQAEPGDMYYSEYYREPAITKEKIAGLPGDDGAITLDPVQSTHAKSSEFPEAGGTIDYDGLGNISRNSPQERGHSPEPIERFPGYSPARPDVRRLRAPPTTLLLSSLVPGRSLLTVIRRRSSWKTSIPIRIT